MKKDHALRRDLFGFLLRTIAGHFVYAFIRRAFGGSDAKQDGAGRQPDFVPKHIGDKQSSARRIKCNVSAK